MIINRSLQTGILRFTVLPIPSHRDFPWLVAKKCSCCINVEIWLLVVKFQKGPIVLVLANTTVTKIVNTFHLGQILLDVKHDYSLQLLNKTGLMLEIIRNDAQWDVMRYTIILEIYHRMMHDTLVLVPVISLDFNLHNIAKIFRKVQENDTLCLGYFSLICLRCWAWLFAVKECVVRLSKLYTSNSTKLSTSAEYIRSVDLSTLSHWLCDISSSISNYVNLFLINFSKSGYPSSYNDGPCIWDWLCRTLP